MKADRYGLPRPNYPNRRRPMISISVTNGSAWSASGITTPAELRQADHKALIAWERYMREAEHAAASTIRRRLAALSSLYKHLVRHGHAARNPVGEVERPAINRDEGSTLAFSKAQARKVLDAPAEDTVAGLRGRGDPVGRICKSGCGAPRSPR